MWAQHDYSDWTEFVLGTRLAAWFVLSQFHFWPQPHKAASISSVFQIHRRLGVRAQELPADLSLQAVAFSA